MNIQAIRDAMGQAVGSGVYIAGGPSASSPTAALGVGLPPWPQ